MRNRRRKNSERKEVISAIVLMLIVTVIVFVPSLICFTSVPDQIEGRFKFSEIEPFSSSTS